MVILHLRKLLVEDGQELLVGDGTLGNLFVDDGFD